MVQMDRYIDEIAEYERDIQEIESQSNCLTDESYNEIQAMEHQIEDLKLGYLFDLLLDGNDGLKKFTTFLTDSDQSRDILVSIIKRFRRDSNEEINQYLLQFFENDLEGLIVNMKGEL